MPNKVTNKFVPPKETKGNGTPVSGNKPMILAMFINICADNQTTMPKATNLAKLSVLCRTI